MEDNTLAFALGCEDETLVLLEVKGGFFAVELAIFEICKVIANDEEAMSV